MESYLSKNGISNTNLFVQILCTRCLSDVLFLKVQYKKMLVTILLNSETFRIFTYTYIYYFVTGPKNLATGLGLTCRNFLFLIATFLSFMLAAPAFEMSLGLVETGRDGSFSLFLLFSSSRVDMMGTALKEM